MILAAPLVIPFAEAIGLSVATLGIAKASDMVNEYIQENPEQSMKIFQMIMPSQGIANALKNKSSDEEVEEDIEVEDIDARDLTKKEKAKEMKRRFKEGTGDKREIGKKGYEEIILPGKEDEMLDDAEDRYDGGVEDAPKPKFDYKKFFKKRYADGGAIGIEVLFEPKREKFNTGGIGVGGSTSLASLQRQGYQLQKNQPTYNARATTQDYANALQKVSAGTTYQQQAQAKQYARNEAANELRAARQGGDVALDNFFCAKASSSWSFFKL